MPINAALKMDLLTRACIRYSLYLFGIDCDNKYGIILDSISRERIYPRPSKSIKLIDSTLLSRIITAIDHITTKTTFANNLIRLKYTQAYIQESSEKSDEVSRAIHESGDDVNIIINRESGR